jgi:PIN domain nuclease of toxin-antitoxin system
MRLLVDTHVAMWAVNSVQRLPHEAIALLEGETNEVFVSILSVWEIAIKRPLRRSDPPPMSAAAAMEEFEAAGFTFLPIAAEHVIQVEALSLHHRDPFDRLLIAQAFTEGMRLVTHDRQLAVYGDFVMTF